MMGAEGEGGAGSATGELPSHVGETVRAVAALHAEHHRAATRLQRAANRAAAMLGHPASLAALAVPALGWIGLNLLAPSLGIRPADPPPFPALEAAATLASFFMVVLLLVAQRHADRLAERREQLILQMAVLGERRMAKVIGLLEEHRRDNPQMRDREDPEADAMARPADPSSVLDAIRETHDRAEEAVP